MELKSRAEMNPEFMWDLTHMFKDNGEFEKAFSEAETLVGKIASLKGTLGESLQSLKNGLDTVYSVDEKVEPVYIYTMLRKSGDSSDPENLDMNGRATRLLVSLSASSSFIEPEILAIPEDKMNEFLADESLSKYHFLLQEV